MHFTFQIFDFQDIFLTFYTLNTSVFGHSMSSVKSEAKARIYRPSTFQRDELHLGQVIKIQLRKLTVQGCHSLVLLQPG